MSPLLPPALPLLLVRCGRRKEGSAQALPGRPVHLTCSCFLLPCHGSLMLLLHLLLLLPQGSMQLHCHKADAAA
jgi:hypothetical protein